MFNQQMLEGGCSTDSLSMLQRYTKNVKKTNILIKKTLGRGKNIHRLGKLKKKMN